MKKTNLSPNGFVKMSKWLFLPSALIALCSTPAMAANGAAGTCSPSFSDYKVEIFSNSSPEQASINQDVTIFVPNNPMYKVLGGGAIVHTLDGDSFLTASYPEVDPGETVPIGWTASSKHIGEGTKARITAYAIAVLDPSDCWNVKMFNSAPSATAAHPASSVSVGSGYVLTGGGAKVAQHANGNGNFLFKSMPNSSGNGWDVQSKDHATSDPSTIVAYAIGIQASGAGVVTPNSHSLAGKPSSALNNPSAYANGYNTVLPGINCTLTGGGANDAWTGFGNMLTAIYPAGTAKWQSFARSWSTDDASVLTAYTVCLN
ncbi:MAG: hypothetical protein P1U67_02590 [Alcanivoracaceae bacterium]|nr:hypothetical protein [Alcanivoracaceae bacterium]